MIKISYKLIFLKFFLLKNRSLTIYYRNMSQFNSHIQSPDPENHQPSPISAPYNSQGTVSSHESSTANEDDHHVTNAAQSQEAVQTPVIEPAQINHPNIFFFRPPNDFYHYHVICKEISYDVVEQLLNNPSNGSNANENECVFFYQQKCNDRFYQISCEIVSPLFVNNCLCSHFLGLNFITWNKSI